LLVFAFVALLDHLIDSSTRPEVHRHCISDCAQQRPAMAAGGSGGATCVRFVPLIGVHSRQPLSYLLEVEGFTFLLDCGWNDAYDTLLLQPLVDVLPQIDAGDARCNASAC
jgi:hypothetical protein